MAEHDYPKIRVTAEWNGVEYDLTPRVKSFIVVQGYDSQLRPQIRVRRVGDSERFMNPLGSASPKETDG